MLRQDALTTEPLDLRRGPEASLVTARHVYSQTLTCETLACETIPDKRPHLISASCLKLLTFIGLQLLAN